MKTCDECYALVNEECAALHQEWHDRIERAIGTALIRSERTRRLA